MPKSTSRAILDVQPAEPMPKKGRRGRCSSRRSTSRRSTTSTRLRAAIEKLRGEMRQAAADLEFERAAALRDKARELEQLELQMR